MSTTADACVFCAVASGDAVARIVFADEHVVAFLDRSPVFKGHVLVAPRRHFTALPDLEANEVQPFFSAVQRIAAVVPQALGADGTFVAINNVVSQSVPHLHAHVVPRRHKDGLRGFFWPRVRYADDREADDFATRLSAALADR